MKNADQQIRLRRFWGVVVFSLGMVWGVANLVYIPVAVLTSMVGSSWFEVFIIIAGGVLTFSASIVAFYRRRGASLFLLLAGGILLALALYRHLSFSPSTHGIINVSLIFLSGSIAILLGLFGIVTDRKGWPALQELP
jgi:hypothetical protein